ncbi:MAG: phosphatase PAP2 family protein [Actinomycetia bacterium]|nr:phosphatase PAP2 family protein [Actinomycetes bacterium]
MTPALVTVLVAVTAAAVTYAALGLRHRHAGLKGGIDLETTEASDGSAVDAVPSPSRFVGAAVALSMLIFAGIVLGGLAQGIERETVVVRWDERVERWASQNAGVLGSDALRLITHLGDTVVIVALAAVVALTLLALRRRRLSLFVVLVVFGQWALSNLIKEAAARARPDLDPLAPFSGYSFPSGHATAAAASYLALALVLVAVRPSWNERLIVAAGVGIAVAVAASRAMLGVHWFSDVLGGLVLGWTWCVACAWLMRLTRTSREQKLTAT